MREMFGMADLVAPQSSRDLKLSLKSFFLGGFLGFFRFSIGNIGFLEVVWFSQGFSTGMPIVFLVSC